MKIAILTAALLVGTSAGVYAQGCNSDHYASEPVMQDQLAKITDDSQVLTTGQISVAGVDCVATPDAAECTAMSTPATN